MDIIYGFWQRFENSSFNLGRRADGRNYDGDGNIVKVDETLSKLDEWNEMTRFLPVCFSLHQKMAQSAKPISSPVPDAWYPSLAVFMLAIGLIVTASFFIYEATSSRRNRSLAKELTTGAVASVFLGFGSLFLLLASGVYV